MSRFLLNKLKLDICTCRLQLINNNHTVYSIIVQYYSQYNATVHTGIIAVLV